METVLASQLEGANSSSRCAMKRMREIPEKNCRIGGLLFFVIAAFCGIAAILYSRQHNPAFLGLYLTFAACFASVGAALLNKGKKS